MLIDKNYALNSIGRCHDIRETLSILIDTIELFGLNVDIKMSKPFKYLCHSIIKVPSINFAVNGKGVNDVISLTSAYAELIERLSAFPESWHEKEGGFNLLRQPPDRRELFGKIYDHSYLDGYKQGRYSDFDNPIDIHELLRNTVFNDDQIELIKDKSVYTRTWVTAKAVFEVDKIYQVPVHLVKFLNGSNGLAAGRTMVEAIIHGTMEVLERYICMRMFTQKEVLPTIDTSRITDQYIMESLQYFEENDIEIILKDVSFSLGIPAVAAMTFNKRLSPGHRGYNFLKVGVSTNTRHAIMRALTERMQGTTFVEERMLGDITEGDKRNKYELFFNTGKTFIDLTPFRKGPVVPVREWVYRDTDEALNVLKEIIEKLESKLLVVDYTHKNLKIPVVQIIVPGVSDNVLIFGDHNQTMAYLGGVDEKQLAVERNLEEIYKTFF